MSQFMYYKYVFFIGRHARKYANVDYSKEKFIDGIPKSIAEMLKFKLKERIGGIIPYSQ